MAFNIYDIIFYQLLRFDPASSFLTGEFVHDLLYGIIIPVIFLFFIVDSFAAAIFQNKLKHLVAVATIGVIITSGWYPVIAELTSSFFVVLLILSILLWIKFRAHGIAGVFEVGIEGGSNSWDDARRTLENVIRLALRRAMLLEEVDQQLRQVDGDLYTAWEREYENNIEIAQNIIDRFGNRARREARNILTRWERNPHDPDLTPELRDHFHDAAHRIAERVRRRLNL